MPNLNISLTPELHDFVLTSVHSGRYENPSELVRIALNTLRGEVRNPIKKHTASDTSHGDPFRKLWENSDHPLVSS
jgi:putative addiction module CopG family antidote